MKVFFNFLPSLHFKITKVNEKQVMKVLKGKYDTEIDAKTKLEEEILSLRRKLDSHSDNGENKDTDTNSEDGSKRFVPAESIVTV